MRNAVRRKIGEGRTMNNDIPDGFEEHGVDAEAVKEQLGLSGHPLDVKMVGRHVVFTVPEERDQ
ncbi:hypothetical protein [Natrinema sp. DC36]|uniref:hypothetical protein n=1 Tax=Natrinema sp. DC36 TaxID=2878680 RepID=UPI001CEFFAB0|nr:hypothetical protein [Natrinema sp. DC36]